MTSCVGALLNELSPSDAKDFRGGRAGRSFAFRGTGPRACPRMICQRSFMALNDVMVRQQFLLHPVTLDFRSVVSSDWRRFRGHRRIWWYATSFRGESW